jgi:hypothetical protein
MPLIIQGLNPMKSHPIQTDRRGSQSKKQRDYQAFKAWLLRKPKKMHTWLSPRQAEDQQQDAPIFSMGCVTCDPFSSLWIQALFLYISHTLPRLCELFYFFLLGLALFQLGFLQTWASETRSTFGLWINSFLTIASLFCKCLPMTFFLENSLESI